VVRCQFLDVVVGETLTGIGSLNDVLHDEERLAVEWSLGKLDPRNIITRTCIKRRT
jgi:hypothetical protein